MRFTTHLEHPQVLSSAKTIVNFSNGWFDRFEGSRTLTMMKFLFALLALGLITEPLSLQGSPLSFAQGDPARFAAVHERMEGFVEDHTIAGAVTLLATHDRILSLDTAGFADL